MLLLDTQLYMLLNWKKLLLVLVVLNENIIRLTTEILLRTVYSKHVRHWDTEIFATEWSDVKGYSNNSYNANDASSGSQHLWLCFCSAAALSCWHYAKLTGYITDDCILLQSGALQMLGYSFDLAVLGWLWGSESGPKNMIRTCIINYNAVENGKCH